jgi:hypothetical protein
VRGPRGGLLPGTPEYKARQKEHAKAYYLKHREEILRQKKTAYYSQPFTVASAMRNWR